MIDHVGPEFQMLPPRPICLCRGEKFNPWELPRFGFLLLSGSGACVLVGRALMNMGFLVSFLGTGLYVFGGLLLLFSIPMNCLFIFRIINHASLIRSGLVAVGEVMKNEPKSDGDFGGWHEVSYRFYTNRGREVRGKWATADEPFWLSQEQDHFLLFYDKNWPRRNVAYLSALFRVSE